MPLRSLSRSYNDPIDGAYTKNLLFLTVWFLYPVIFAVGPEGTRSIDTNASSWTILILDVVAKVVYAFFAASNIEKALSLSSTRD